MLKEELFDSIVEAAKELSLPDGWRLGGINDFLVYSPEDGSDPIAFNAKDILERLAEEEGSSDRAALKRALARSGCVWNALAAMSGIDPSASPAGEDPIPRDPLLCLSACAKRYALTYEDETIIKTLSLMGLHGSVAAYVGSYVRLKRQAAKA